jgi:hypothetical protein
VTTIRSGVKVFQRFPEITRRVEEACKEGLDLAAAEAATVAQATASINLELEVLPAAGTVDGYSAGIKSRRTSSKGRRGGSAEQNTTPIAWFFDRGTLGKRSKALKRPRKESWPVTRGGSTFAATRQDVTGKGVDAEHFFGKGRAAGRRKLIERLNRP